jgi:hypothetical protein
VTRHESGSCSTGSQLEEARGGFLLCNWPIAEFGGAGSPMPTDRH